MKTSIPKSTRHLSDTWHKVRLGDIASIISGGTPSTKNSENYNGEISWITPRDLSSHNERYISYGERSITQKGLDSSSAKLLPPNTVLFTSRAPIGYIAIAKNEVATNQGFKNLILQEGNEPEFFYYLLKHITPTIKSYASGSTFLEISKSVLKSIEVIIPSSKLQKAIAHILGTLDDKIEHNQKKITVLEEIAKAIFKSWFVDFDPVYAKAKNPSFPPLPNCQTI
ncbi:MAG: restriction endonuclease subunit S [Gammaproteobacteria bacterium AqS3]|nr:restriction endonuclease subunit S [Gammaproteobacteria bacterium AqS3]